VGFGPGRRQGQAGIDQPGLERIMAERQLIGEEDDAVGVGVVELDGDRVLVHAHILPYWRSLA
jgi:hypothetical protein